MPGEVDRLDGRDRFRQLVSSGNSKLLAPLLSELGAAEARKLIDECYSDEPVPPLVQCAKKAGDGSQGKPEELLDCCRLLIKYGCDVNKTDPTNRTALHWACASGNAGLVSLLLDHGADPSAADASGFNSLHLAVNIGSIECARLIVGHTKELTNRHDGNGATPILTAVEKGDLDLLEMLVTSGGDVNVQERTSRRTALHYSLYLKKRDIFEYLLDCGADLAKTDHRETNIVHRCCAVSDPWFLEQILKRDSPDTTKALRMEDSEGATPVIVACQNGNIDQLRMLVEAGAPVANKDHHRRCALHHCAENTDTRCAEYILRSIPSLLTSADEEGLAPLHMAVIAGNIPLIKLLLKRGANLKAVDNERHTVAHWATVCGHSDVLDVLLENGAELSTPDKHQAYPIHYAAQMTSRTASGDGSESDGSHLILKTLLKNKVSPESEDKDKRTPIIWAASAGNDEACKILVEFGADVNRADKDDLTALHCAASRGHSSCVTTLIKHCKAEVDPVDKNQCTPLFYATTLGHIECMRVLLDIGADGKHTDTRGRTIGHCATVNGATGALEVLREYRADLWARNLKGDQPIHEASQSGHIEVVRYLLEHADCGQSNVIDSGNNDGRTCLHIAALTNNVWLCKFLLEKGANVNAVMMNKGKYYTPYDAALIKGHKEAKDLLYSQSGRPASTVTDHAAETIQVKYRYHVKHKAPTSEPAGTPGAEAVVARQHAERASAVNLTPPTGAHRESGSGDTVEENDKAPADSEPADSPKYVDKSTQITTARSPKLKPLDSSKDSDRIGAGPSTSSAASNNRISGQFEEIRSEKHSEFDSEELDRVQERPRLPPSKPNSPHPATRQKRKLIRSGKSSRDNTSHSEEGETHSERSTSHGNTSDIESCSSDHVLRNKVRRPLKARGACAVIKPTPQNSADERVAPAAEKSGRKQLSIKSSSEESSWHDKRSLETKENGVHQQHAQRELSQEVGALKSFEHSTSLSSDEDRVEPRRVTARGSPHSSGGSLSPRGKSAASSHSEMGAACGAMKDPSAVPGRSENSLVTTTAGQEEPVPLKKRPASKGRTTQNHVKTKPKNSRQVNGHVGKPTTPKSGRNAADEKSGLSARKLKPIEKNDAVKEGDKTHQMKSHSNREESRSPRKNTLTPIEKNGSDRQTGSKSESQEVPSRKSSPRKSPKANRSFDDLRSESDGGQGHPTPVESTDGDKADKEQNKPPVDQGYTDVEGTDSGQLHGPRKKKTRPAMLIQNIQASVRRYEHERDSIRQLHQIKRALIYAGPANDRRVFRKVMTQHQQTNGADSWDVYLKEQVKLLQEERKRNYPKSASRNGNKSADGRDTPKAGYSFSYKRTLSLERQTSPEQQPHNNSNSLDETRRDSHDVTSKTSNTKRPHFNSQSVDHYGYYDDPRRSNSWKAIKKRQDFARLQLIKAYRPFAGAEIYPSMTSRPTTGAGRPTSTMSVGTNSSLGSKSNGRKPQNSTTVMTLYGSRKIRQGNNSDIPSNTDREKSQNKKSQTKNKSMTEKTPGQGISIDKENLQETLRVGTPQNGENRHNSPAADQGSLKQEKINSDMTDSR